MRLLPYIFLLALMLLPFCAQSQQKGGPPQIGLGWTGMLYTGDLTVDERDYLRLYPGGNIYLQFSNYRKFRLRMNAGFGKVVEQWDRPVVLSEDQQQANTYFETNLFYIDLRLMRYFFTGGIIQPYIGFGPSLFFFNPKDQDGSFLIDNIFTREEGEEFPTTTLVWPATLGFSVPFGKTLSVSADYTYRLNMSDYVDNIGLLGKDPGRDRIHSFQVSLNINLGVEEAAPIMPQEIAPKEVEKPVQVLSFQEQEGFSVDKLLKYRPIKDGHHRQSDKVNQSEVDYILYEEMPRVEKPEKGSVFSPSPGPTGVFEHDQDYWEGLWKIAEAYHIYKEVKADGVLSKKAWAQVHHISLDAFEKLNPGLPEVVPFGSNIMVPDWEAVKEF